MFEMILPLLGYFFGALAAFVVVKAAYVTWDQLRIQKRFSAVYQGPKIEFPFGNTPLKAIYNDTMGDWHKDNVEKYCSEDKMCYTLYGPLFLRSISGCHNELVSADPRIVKHVLNDHFEHWAKTYPNGRFLGPADYFLGEGIFTIDHGKFAERPPTYGKMWQHQRRTAATIFTRGLFKTFYQDVFLSHTHQLVDTLKTEVGPKGENTIDFQFWMMALTMDCFGKIAFGAELNNLNKKDTGFGAAFDGVHQKVFDSVFGHVHGILLRELLPTKIGDLAQWLFIELGSKHFAEMKEHSRVLNTYTQNIVDKKKASIASGEDTSQTDLLHLFMQMSKDEGVAVPDKEFRDIVANFMIAGRDTTAGTLSWLFYRLGLEENKEILKTIHEEIDTVLGGATPTHDDLQELPYLHGALWESLRLHPVVPRLEVVCKADDVLPDGTKVPKGTQMVISNYAMGRCKQRYGETAELFKPERWIPFKQPSPFEFPMFKAGRRICLGKDMAIFEAMTVATMVLQNFTPITANPENITYGTKFTATVHDTKAKKDQLMMNLIPRN